MPVRLINLQLSNSKKEEEEEEEDWDVFIYIYIKGRLMPQGINLCLGGEGGMICHPRKPGRKINKNQNQLCFSTFNLMELEVPEISNLQKGMKTL